MAFEDIIEEMEIVEINGHDYLFTNSRIDRDLVKEEVYVYEVRDNDYFEGVFEEISNNIVANHFGTIIGKDPLPLDCSGSYYPNENDVNYLGYADVDMGEYFYA